MMALCLRVFSFIVFLILPAAAGGDAGVASDARASASVSSHGAVSLRVLADGRKYHRARHRKLSELSDSKLEAKGNPRARHRKLSEELDSKLEVKSSKTILKRSRKSHGKERHLASTKAVRAHAAHKREVTSCDPQLAILHLAVAGQAGQFFHSGTPIMSNRAGKINEICPSVQIGCCKDAFLDALAELRDDESARMDRISDMYQNTLNVHAASLGVTVRSDQGIAAEVVDYISQCERPLREYFDVMSCRLCDPHLPEKVTDARYFQVRGGESCKKLWKSCKDFPDRLLKASHRLRAAASHAKDAVAAGNLKSMAVQDVAHWWLLGASLQVEALSGRISGWLGGQKPVDSKVFCEHLQAEGFAYQPEAWGHLDMLHPSAALDPGSTPALGDEIDVKGCVHGTSKKGNGVAPCVCHNHCWRGERCNEAVPPGPLQEQALRPFENTGLEQTIELFGCDLLQNMEAHLARIKLIRAGDGVHADRGSFTCDQKPEAEFKHLEYRVPASFSASAIAWVISIPSDANGLYAVCYCTGPDCKEGGCQGQECETKSPWLLVGTVGVEEKLRDVLIDVVSASIIDDKGESGELFDAPTPMKPMRSCDKQFLGLATREQSSIDFVENENLIEFMCKKGFVDLQGTRTMQCLQGTWQVHTAWRAEKEGEGMEPWSRKLPWCRWRRRHCNSPRNIQNGQVWHDRIHGLARHRCNKGMDMLVGEKISKASFFEKRCMNKTWIPNVPIKCNAPVPETKIHKQNGTAISFLELASGSRTEASASSAIRIAQRRWHTIPNFAIISELNNLHIQRWPVRFTEEREDAFDLDRCFLDGSCNRIHDSWSTWLEFLRQSWPYQMLPSRRPFMYSFVLLIIVLLFRVGQSKLKTVDKGKFDLSAVTEETQAADFFEPLQEQILFSPAPASVKSTPEIVVPREMQTYADRLHIGSHPAQLQRSSHGP